MISTPVNSSRLICLVAGTWLILLSIALAVLILTRQDTPNVQIAELQTRTLELEALLASIETAPAAVTEADFQRTRDHWQQQWDSLNQRQQDFASAIELAAMQNRFDALMQQVNTATPVANKPRPRVAKPRALPPNPTFQLLGIESRGGERFLAIQPNGTTGLAAVRLLRIGDAEGGWQLEDLQPRSALFRFDQQTLRLPLPEE